MGVFGWVGSVEWVGCLCGKCGYKANPSARMSLEVGLGFTISNLDLHYRKRKKQNDTSIPHRGQCVISVFILNSHISLILTAYMSHITEFQNMCHNKIFKTH